MTENDGRPSETERIMLTIKALDPSASLLFSKYTGKWYVNARIEIGDGTILNGGSEHRSTPEEAVLAYFERLTNTTLDQYVVSTYRGERPGVALERSRLRRVHTRPRAGATEGFLVNTLRPANPI